MNYDYLENGKYRRSITTGIIGMHGSAPSLDFDFALSFNAMLPFASFGDLMDRLALFVTGYFDLRRRGGSQYE